MIGTLDENIVGRYEAIDFYRKLLMMKNKKNEWMIIDDYKELAEFAMILL